MKESNMQTFSLTNEEFEIIYNALANDRGQLLANAAHNRRLGRDDPETNAAIENCEKRAATITSVIDRIKSQVQ